MVRCSAGTTFKVDSDLIDLQRDDVILMCGGVDIQTSTSKRVLNWLRREARKGPKIGGLCTAAYTLAKAGLLDNKRATIHWENSDSFAEELITLILGPRPSKCTSQPEDMDIVAARIELAASRIELAASRIETVLGRYKTLNDPNKK